MRPEHDSASTATAAPSAVNVPPSTLRSVRRVARPFAQRDVPASRRTAATRPPAPSPSAASPREDAPLSGVSPSLLLDGETPPPSAIEPPDESSGVYALMRAVLLDAIDCLTGHGVLPRHRARVAMQARVWFSRRDRSFLFSYESICDVLGLDADRLRKKLLTTRRPTRAALAGMITSSEPSITGRVA